MLTFAHPWLLILLPLPVAALLLPAYALRRPGLLVPFFDRLAAQTDETARTGGAVEPRSWPHRLILAASWVMIVSSLMRPQWIDPPLHRDLPTRDLLLLVDLSGSMDTKDFVDASGKTMDRLAAVKEVLGDFLERRMGDRVGVVVFGDAPFLLVPFSTDLKLSRTLLDGTAVGMAGPRTALGDAIGLGISLFDKSTAKAKTIIALTDGNDTASKVPPAEAAGVAKDRGIVIHAVAVGDPAAAGEDKLDEQALRDVAAATGGSFFRALDRNQLEGIYRRLDAIETRRIDTLTFRPKTEIFWMPLAAVLILTMAAQGVRLVGAPLFSRRRKVAAA